MTKSLQKKLMSPVLLIIPIFFTMLVTTTFAQSSNTVGIFPQNSKPFGLSYEDHIKNYWKFAIKFPNENNPWTDKTGGMCRNGQESVNSSIFYLPSGGGGDFERVCKIPAGVGLFIPVLVGEMSLLEAENGTKSEDLPGLAKADQGNMHVFTLSIGDKKLDSESLKKYGFLTGLFNLTFPRENLFGVVIPTNKTTTAAADGYYVITEPLAKGTYVINTYGEMCTLGNDCPGGDNFKGNVTTTVIAE
jgi:hypothetical protein